MKYGIVFPQTEIGNDPAVIKDYAQTVEGLGLSFLLAYDHVVGANPDRPGGWQGRYTHQDAFHEPFVLFAFLAAVTQKLEFATGIIILPQRPAVLVAKQAAEVDVLSGGRLRLGVAIGWNPVEYVALGYNFHDRARRMEEQIAIMRELWTKPLVTFKGEYHTIEDAGLNPLPVQRPIPLWFGGGTDDVIVERITRLGDGWMLNVRSLEEGKIAVDTLHRFLDKAGRDPGSFGLDARLNLQQAPPDRWGSFIEGWQKLGATHLGLNTMGMGFTSPDEHLAMVRRFADFVKV
jgi:probable F420-dependent oxidoreductase